MITFTEQAKSRAMAFLEGQGKKEHVGIRIGVKQKGCNFQYHLDWEKTALPGDAVIVQDELRLFMDNDSYHLLSDAVVDFMERDEQEGFIIRHRNSPCSQCKEATPNCN